MKKIAWLVLASLLALAPEVLAQGAASKASPKKSAPVARKAASPAVDQQEEREFQAAKTKMVDRWLDRVPGGDPIIRESEIRKALGPNIISVDQVQYAAFWKGTYDDCTQAPLMPISKRLKRRLFQLTHQMPGKIIKHDVDNDPGFEKLYIRFLEAIGSPDTVEETFGHGDTRLNIVEENGSREPGVQSPRPLTPYKFTMHGFVLPVIPIDDGVYAGKSIRFVGESWAEKNGSPLRPCFNLSGMFAEMPAAPAEVAYVPPAPTERFRELPAKMAVPPVVTLVKSWKDKDKVVDPPKHFDLKFDLIRNGQVVQKDIELRDTPKLRLDNLKVGDRYSLRENPDSLPKHWVPERSNVDFVVTSGENEVPFTNVKKQTGCKWLGAPCWVWPVVAGAGVGAFCLERHHNNGVPYEAPGKQAVPLPDRPK